MESWNNWVINHYPVVWGREEPDSLGEKKALGEVSFIPGKSLKNGIKIKWLVSDDWEGY
jgi:hypothetical protein